MFPQHYDQNEIDVPFASVKNTYNKTDTEVYQNHRYYRDADHTFLRRIHDGTRIVLVYIDGTRAQRNLRIDPSSKCIAESNYFLSIKEVSVYRSMIPICSVPFACIDYTSVYPDVSILSRCLLHVY